MDLAVPIVVSVLSLAIGGISAIGETPMSAFKKVMSKVLANTGSGGDEPSRNSNNNTRRNADPPRPPAAERPAERPAAPAPAPPPPPPPPPPPRAPPPPPAASNTKNARNNSGAKDDERKPFVPFSPKGSNAAAKPNAAKQRNDMNGDDLNAEGTGFGMPPAPANGQRNGQRNGPMNSPMHPFGP